MLRSSSSAETRCTSAGRFGKVTKGLSTKYKETNRAAQRMSRPIDDIWLLFRFHSRSHVVLSPNGHDYWFMGQKCERNRKIYMNFVVKIAKSL